MKKLIITLLTASLIIGALGTGCNTTQPTTDNTEITNEITDTTRLKITKVTENGFEGNMLTMNNDPAYVSFSEDILFEEGISSTFEIGNIVTFEHGAVMESYPVQIVALKITANEVDEMIQIDDRETVSGLIGAFPEKILRIGEVEAQVDKGSVFAIELEDNPSTGHRWVMQDNENVELIGTGFLEPHTDLVGAPGKTYFGLRLNKKGEYFITFDLISPANVPADTLTIQVFSLDETNTEGSIIEMKGQYLGIRDGMVDIVLGDIVTPFYAENAQELVKGLVEGDTVLVKGEVAEASYRLISIEKIPSEMTNIEGVETFEGEYMGIQNGQVDILTGCIVQPYTLKAPHLLPEDIQEGDNVAIWLQGDTVVEMRIIK